MPKLLHIIASPRAQGSQSRQIGEAYVEARKAAAPGLEVDVLDLSQTALPDFDGDKVAAKMTFFGVGEMDGVTKSAWDQVVEITERFTSADEYVISTPMWNGGIPYKLKHYIDIITQPGLLFGFTPDDGYLPLLENKSAVLATTAGVYAPGADPKYGADFHGAYLEWWLKMVGVTDIRFARLQPSLVTADPAAAQQEAIETAKSLAQSR